MNTVLEKRNAQIAVGGLAAGGAAVVGGKAVRDRSRARRDQDGAATACGGARSRPPR